MIINVINAETIKIYGETDKLANINAKDFIKLIGIDRWRNHMGAQFDSYPGSDMRYSITMTIKPSKK